MKKKLTLRLPLVRMLVILAAAMALTFLLPYLTVTLAEGVKTMNGLTVLKDGAFLRLMPMAVCAGLALALSVIAFLYPKKPIVVGVVAALALSVIAVLPRPIERNTALTSKRRGFYN